jgi:hypothetical protein
LTRIQGSNGVEALLKLNLMIMILSSSASLQSSAVFDSIVKEEVSWMMIMKKSRNQKRIQKNTTKRIQQENPSQ